MNLTFNPEYILKVDVGTVLLMSKENIVDSSSFSDIHFIMRIHPIHAAILSFFDGRNEKDAIEAVSNFLNVSAKFVTSFIERLINNEERIGTVYQGDIIQFPKKCLINTDVKREENYDPNNFDYITNIDVSLKRHKTPTDITIMINNRCATDCVYCYADKRNPIDCQIPLERLKELVSEAKLLQVRSIDIIGGEFFLYKQWRELLIYLKEFGYTPFLSTKVPINENSIRALKEIGVKGLQVSLDTLNKDNLITLLKVKPNYYEKIKKTLRLLDKHGIKIFIHTIFTGINDSIEDVSTIYEFIKNLNYLDNWRIDLPGVSSYKSIENFEKVVKPQKEKADLVIKYLNELIEKDKPKFDIKFNLSVSSYIENDTAKTFVKGSEFSKRSACSANFTSLFILPDGQVTVCEELYWNPRFIIGNVLNQGLGEIWNSEKSLKQYYIEQVDIPEDSACRTCTDFIECRRGQGICHRDIIKSYGDDKWYYPDINCPKSPETLYDIKA